MAKKRLKRPALPEGPRLAFFLYMQDLVLRHGDLPVATLAVAAGISHQAVYKALTGPKMPSRSTTETLVRSIAGQDAVAPAVARWEEAVADERQLRTSETWTRADAFRTTTDGPEPETKPAVLARQELADLIKEAVNKSGWTGGMLAKHANISRSTAYMLLAGKSLPSSYVIRTLAEILPIDRSRLYALYDAARRERDALRVGYQ